jgi:glycosyltransferase 2 family protein
LQLAETAIENKVRLKDNFFNLRTLLGFAVAAFVIIIFLRNFDIKASLQIITKARLPFIIMAVVAFYLSLPLRGARWGSLLKPAGQKVGLAALTHYYFLAWFANAILPARIGDIYRAYLLRKNNNISISLSLGVLFSEKVFDLAISAILMILSGAYFWSVLRNSSESKYLLWGLGATTVVIVFFIAMIFLIPLLIKIAPAKWAGLIESFRSGIFKSPSLLPVIIIMTLLIWLSEALRLYLVFLAFNINAGFLMAVFISQASLILMSIPLSPAGLGLVEILMLKILSASGLSLATAGAITLTDRIISYWSLVASGSIAYLFSPRVR